jgi:hypothetical protein
MNYDVGPPLLGSLALDASEVLLRSDSARVTPPHAAEEVVETEGCYHVNIVAIQARGHLGRRLRPGRHRLRGRVDSENFQPKAPRVPQVHRCLVLRLPGHRRGAFPQGLFGCKVPLSGQVLGVEEGDAYVPYLASIKPRPKRESQTRSRTTPAPTQASFRPVLRNHFKDLDEPRTLPNELDERRSLTVPALPLWGHLDADRSPWRASTQEAARTGTQCFQ